MEHEAVQWLQHVAAQNPVPVSYLYQAGQIVLAALLGGILGIEREWGGHDAGLRTNLLISVSSCVFTLLSINAFPIHGATQDTGRVAAQIVSGVGFLGAGVMLQTKREIRGLTTAATIWLVAAVGMCVGVDQIFLAVFTTVMAVVFLVLLSPLSHWIAAQAARRNGTTPGN